MKSCVNILSSWQTPFICNLWLFIFCNNSDDNLWPLWTSYKLQSRKISKQNHAMKKDSKSSKQRHKLIPRKPIKNREQNKKRRRKKNYEKKKEKEQEKWEVKKKKRRRNEETNKIEKKKKKKKKEEKDKREMKKKKRRKKKKKRRRNGQDWKVKEETKKRWRRKSRLRRDRKKKKRKTSRKTRNDEEERGRRRKPPKLPTLSLIYIKSLKKTTTNCLFCRSIISIFTKADILIEQKMNVKKEVFCNDLFYELSRRHCNFLRWKYQTPIS